MMLDLKLHCWQMRLVISELHHQQSILFYTQLRSILGRMVTLVQCHVRSIVHGQATAAFASGTLARRASACR